MLSIDQACNILHIDPGNNDELVAGLLAAIPGYIEVTTGMSIIDQECEPLCHTVSGFLLTLWYYSDHADDTKLQRTIDSILKCITLKAREMQLREG
jgi:hypothetical protein